jgi:hypothetical protein
MSIEPTYWTPAAQPAQEDCPACDGVGDMFGGFACDQCGGTGKQSTRDSAAVPEVLYRKVKVVRAYAYRKDDTTAGADYTYWHPEYHEGEQPPPGWFRIDYRDVYEPIAAPAQAAAVPEAVIAQIRDDMLSRNWDVSKLHIWQVIETYTRLAVPAQAAAVPEAVGK